MEPKIPPPEPLTRAGPDDQFDRPIGVHPDHLDETTGYNVVNGDFWGSAVSPTTSSAIRETASLSTYARPDTGMRKTTDVSPVIQDPSGNVETSVVELLDHRETNLCRSDVMSATQQLLDR
jgi:hypothetical protein